LIKKWAKESEDYLFTYIHPRDLDGGQPMIKELNALRRFKSYYGLNGAEKKLRKYLSDFEFTDLSTACESVDWGKAKVLKL
jgi:hypothetical protein